MPNEIDFESFETAVKDIQDRMKERPIIQDAFDCAFSSAPRPLNTTLGSITLRVTELAETVGITSEEQQLKSSFRSIRGH